MCADHSTAPASPTCPRATGRTKAIGCTTSLYYKPCQCLLHMVFVLDIDADPAATTPVTLFVTGPQMELEQVYRIYSDRFPSEFNFLDAQQYLELAACQVCTATRHHFHAKAVLAALAWTRLELCHATERALARFAMANVKLKAFLQLVLNRLMDTDGRARPDPVQQMSGDPARPNRRSGTNLEGVASGSGTGAATVRLGLDPADPDQLARDR